MIVHVPCNFCAEKSLPLRYRAGVACGLREMEIVCLESGRRYSLSAWKRLEEGYLCYRAGSLHLANLAVSLGQPRWHVRPKSHYLEHAVYDFERKNLRYMSNYMDEDMIRRIKRMACAATPRYASKHVLFRYAVAATLRWSGMIEWKKTRLNVCSLKVSWERLIDCMRVSRFFAFNRCTERRGGEGRGGEGRERESERERDGERESIRRKSCVYILFTHIIYWYFYY